jgi:hypothetical protein
MASDHLRGDAVMNLGSRALGVKRLPQRAGVAEVQDNGLKTKGRKVGVLEAKSLKAKSLKAKSLKAKSLKAKSLKAKGLRARGQYEAPRV